MSTSAVPVRNADLVSRNVCLLRDTTQQYVFSKESSSSSMVEGIEENGGLVSLRRSILVTGGCGFIGSNFINFWFNRHPNDIIVNYDCLLLQSNPNNIQYSDHPNYHFVQGNLTDRNLLDTVFSVHQFTHVIHFAAASNVDQSFNFPVACSVSNVLGTHTLLESARSYGRLSLFLHISTDEVYGEVAEGTCSESTSPFSPTNPYAASKAGAECLVMSYGKSFNLPYIITRSNNVYGKYQFPLQAIPRFIMCLLDSKPMPVHGAGLTSRTFIHTLDKCAALEVVLEKGTVGEVYNIGTENEITVIELCNTIMKKMLGKNARLDNWIARMPDRCYNDCRYSVDTSKIRSLGWTPKVSFDKGLDETISWYKKNRDHWKNRSKK